MRHDSMPGEASLCKRPRVEPAVTSSLQAFVGSLSGLDGAAATVGARTLLDEALGIGKRTPGAFWNNCVLGSRCPFGRRSGSQAVGGMTATSTLVTPPVIYLSWRHRDAYLLSVTVQVELNTIRCSGAVSARYCTGLCRDQRSPCRHRIRMI
jgi:hypothetical protein